ncbi:MAG: hypothetical protein HY261_07045 [Chloroflexi bacterium]|nr:hypothetical protein [Chloroflexota bacterium]
MRKLLLVLAGAAAVVLVLAACSREQVNPSYSEARISEWKIVMEPESIQPGKATIRAINQGQQLHDIIILKTDLPDDKLPVTGFEVDLAKAGEVIDKISQVPSGKAQSLFHELPAGHYVILDNLPGHYQAGNHASLFVGEAAPETATAAPGGQPSAQPSKPPAGPPGTVAVQLSEFKLTADKLTVTAGGVTFNATNGGAIPHELVVIKTDLAPDALPSVGGSVDVAKAGTKVGEIPDAQLGAKKSASVTLNLAPGKYALICNVPGHYDAGMRTALQVQ